MGGCPLLWFALPYSIGRPRLFSMWCLVVDGKLDSFTHMRKDRSAEIIIGYGRCSSSDPITDGVVVANNKHMV